MNTLCQLTKEKWEAYKRGLSLDSQEVKEIGKHLQTCNRCREFAYQHSFFPFLKESYREKAPEPSERFLTIFPKNCMN